MVAKVENEQIKSALKPTGIKSVVGDIENDTLCKPKEEKVSGKATDSVQKSKRKLFGVSRNLVYSASNMRQNQNLQDKARTNFEILTSVKCNLLSSAGQ